MRHPLPACVAVLCLLPLGVAQVNGKGGGPSVVESGHPSGSIQLDGKLDEPAWREAKTVELAQQSPQPGAPTPYRTRVRVLIVDNKLYFGFECTDPNPKAIAVHTAGPGDHGTGAKGLAVASITHGTGWGKPEDGGSGSRVTGQLPLVGPSLAADSRVSFPDG